MSRRGTTRQRRRQRLVVSAGFLVASLLTAGAHADSCARQTQAVGKSADGRFMVKVGWAASSTKEVPGQWAFLWHDTETKKTTHGVVQGLQEHAHPSVLVTPEGKTFAVFDPGAGHRRVDRLLIYSQDGKLLKSFGVDDLLKPDELVERSTSHLLWMGYDEEKKRSWWVEKDGATLSLLTKAGRLVQVSLTDARIVPKPVAEVNRFAIVLALKAAPDIRDVKLADKALLTEADVVSYDPRTHTMELTHEGFQKLPSAGEVGVTGKPFVVVADGQRCYLGAFWTVYSSIAHPNPVIDVARKSRTVTVQRAYPSERFAKGPDPRSDKRVLKALAELKKLKEAPDSAGGGERE